MKVHIGLLRIVNRGVYLILSDSEMISYELLVANCELPFKEINLRVASYFLQAAVLKE